MAHHVLVIGGGYAGLLAAKRIARQVRRDEVRVTLVNDHENFVERIRLHQMATGQRLPTRTLAGMVRGTGVRVVVGEVVALDRRARQVRLRTEERSRVIGYDTLVYALGSGADTETVPGVADHAYSLADVEHARAFASKALRELAASGRRVCVVGGGLTGIGRRPSSPSSTRTCACAWCRARWSAPGCRRAGAPTCGASCRPSKSRSGSTPRSRR